MYYELVHREPGKQTKSSWRQSGVSAWRNAATKGLDISTVRRLDIQLASFLFDANV